MEFQVNAEMFALVVGGILSFIFSLAPKLNTWFAAHPENYKKLFQLGLMVATALVIYFGSCNWSIFTTDLACGQEGIWRLVTILFSGIVGNQGIFRITPKIAVVEAAKVD
jgi:hypothetical protein